MTSPAHRPRLVLVDPDDRRRARLEALGRELGLRCAPIRAAADAPDRPDPRAALVICVGPAEAGALARLRAACPGARLIVAAADRGQDAAIQALRAGADDFVSLSGGDADLAARVAHHLSEMRGAAPADEAAPDAEALRCGLVGASRAIAELRAFLRRVAASEATALIAGETGAGKECAALMLHRCSRRANGPLVALNCAAIPDELVEGELFGHVRGAFSGAVRDHPGKMRLADGGTLFLDEVGDLSAAAQAKLLRAIETREVHALGARVAARFDARVIAATNRDLAAEVAAGRFREDLFYRLAVARIRVPPLRERREDVAPLARLLLSRMARPARLSEPAAAALVAHDWPGNARELRNALEVAAIGREGREIRLADLPPGLRPPGWVGEGAGGWGQEAAEDERLALADALRRAGGNKAAAARALNCSRMTLYRRMARHGMGDGQGA
ncbi:sigma-54 dependent transcriptional regulator [Albimonas sp. CAU 1670]|uniref:sigma-54 interaction domain-containing protein n=1 Tax=Albimonas sp. CAU 1670 TaxID=3032599 RepID=UPI0023DB21BC|nr:sigma-54 dependent transcriptional regulator [Albimonas sp. CAU 1670]MDF2232608.1 sigma-54 dependent transcriptional regulator [Albimonas sp. CAU 1670]